MANFVVSLAFVCAFGSHASMARDKAAKAPESDINSIEVVGHLPLEGAALQNIVTGEHLGRRYIYLSWVGKMVVVDVTKASSPVVTHEYAFSPQVANRVQAVVGNVGVFADSPPATAPPHVVSIMTFADPLKPRLVRQFNNVIALLVNNGDPQMYIVDKDGLWVLLRKPGPDVRLEQQYSHEVLYNH